MRRRAATRVRGSRVLALVHYLTPMTDRHSSSRERDDLFSHAREALRIGQDEDIGRMDSRARADSKARGCGRHTRRFADPRRQIAMDFNDPRPTDWQRSGNNRVFRSVSEACRYALGSRPAPAGIPSRAIAPDEMHANRLLAIAGFTLCFLFLLAVVVLACAWFRRRAACLTQRA
jgi:hypothetical protein